MIISADSNSIIMGSVIRRKCKTLGTESANFNLISQELYSLMKTFYHQKQLN
jgi:hypothetical protein